MKDNEAIVEIELSDEDFMTLANMAHDQDITFNQLVNNLLREQMERIETKDEDVV
jgi:predicted HicB family RNase H-like nuclease